MRASCTGKASGGNCSCVCVEKRVGVGPICGVERVRSPKEGEVVKSICTEFIKLEFHFIFGSGEQVGASIQS